MTIEEYNKNPNKCINCNSTILFNVRKKRRNRKYCCLDCANKHLKKIRIENALKKYTENPFYCNWCNKLILFEKRHDKKSDLKFCNNFCSRKHRAKYYPLSDDAKKRIAEKQRKIQPKIWTKEKCKIHSDLMKKFRDEHPEFYSSENVCGRVKGIIVKDSSGNETKCLGSWEKIVVDFLDKNLVRWTNKIKEEFLYNWNGSIHRYFPDFYLIDKDLYIEVKGFERDRDREKWKQFPKKLKILKLREIQQIQRGEYTFEKMLQV